MSLTGDTTLVFSDEQAMVLDTARGFCREHGGAAVRPWLESEHGHDPAVWERMVALGWPGLALPESVGGAGLGVAAAVPVMEAMGRGMLGTPLLATLLAGQLLQRAAGEAAVVREVLAELAAGVPATIAWLEGEDWGKGQPDCQLSAEGTLRGSKQQVLDAALAAWVIVVARQGDEPVLALLPGSAIPDSSRRDHRLVDATRRAQSLHLDGVQVAPEYQLRGPAVAQALRDLQLVAALLVAAEAGGSAASCLDTTVDYLNTREQFGKPIGSYQALKHPCVDILIAVDSTRSLVYHAASLLEESPVGRTPVGRTPEGRPPVGRTPERRTALSRDAEIACRMAKAQAGDTLVQAGDRAVQFHGAMGFTWDCDAQLYLRRALWSQAMFGDARHHRRQLASLLLDA